MYCSAKQVFKNNADAFYDCCCSIAIFEIVIGNKGRRHRLFWGGGRAPLTERPNGQRRNIAKARLSCEPVWRDIHFIALVIFRGWIVG